MHVIDYNVVEAGDAEDLVQAVKQAMSAGWQPLGGVSVSVETIRNVHFKGDDQDQTTYSQAMVMYG